MKKCFGNDIRFLIGVFALGALAAVFTDCSNAADNSHPSAKTVIYVDPEGIGKDADSAGFSRSTPVQTLTFAYRQASVTEGVQKILIMGSPDPSKELIAAGRLEKGLPPRDESIGEAIFDFASIQDDSNKGRELVVSGEGSRVAIRGFGSGPGRRVVNVRSGARIRFENIRIAQGDTALNGGGIYVEEGGYVVLGSGCVVEGNTAAGKGSGVYVSKGTLVMTSDASVTSADRDLANDVYLESSDDRLTVMGELTGTLPAAVIVVNGDTDRYVLSGSLKALGSGARPNHERFTVRVFDGGVQVNEYGYGTAKDGYIDDTGFLHTGNPPYSRYYVAPYGDDDRKNTDGSPDSEAGLLPDKPFATLSYALGKVDSRIRHIEVLDNLAQSGEIIFSNLGSREILISGTYDRDVTIAPLSGSPVRLFTLNAGAKIFFDHITIAGGSAVNGGAFMVENGASLTLGDGVVVTGNTAVLKGNGAYVKAGGSLVLMGTVSFAVDAGNMNDIFLEREAAVQLYGPLMTHRFVAGLSFDEIASRLVLVGDLDSARDLTTRPNWDKFIPLNSDSAVQIGSDGWTIPGYTENQPWIRISSPSLKNDVAYLGMIDPETFVSSGMPADSINTVVQLRLQHLTFTPPGGGSVTNADRWFGPGGEKAPDGHLRTFDEYFEEGGFRVTASAAGTMGTESLVNLAISGTLARPLSEEKGKFKITVPREVLTLYGEPPKIDYVVEQRLGLSVSTPPSASFADATLKGVYGQALKNTYPAGGTPHTVTIVVAVEGDIPAAVLEPWRLSFTAARDIGAPYQSMWFRDENGSPVRLPQGIAASVLMGTDDPSPSASSLSNGTLIITFSAYAASPDASPPAALQITLPPYSLSSRHLPVEAEGLVRLDMLRSPAVAVDLSGFLASVNSQTAGELKLSLTGGEQFVRDSFPPDLTALPIRDWFDGSLMSMDSDWGTLTRVHLMNTLTDTDADIASTWYTGNSEMERSVRISIPPDYLAYSTETLEVTFPYDVTAAATATLVPAPGAITVFSAGGPDAKALGGMAGQHLSWNLLLELTGNRFKDPGAITPAVATGWFTGLPRIVDGVFAVAVSAVTVVGTEKTTLRLTLGTGSELASDLTRSDALARGNTPWQARIGGSLLLKSDADLTTADRGAVKSGFIMDIIPHYDVTASPSLTVKAIPGTDVPQNWTITFGAADYRPALQSANRTTIRDFFTPLQGSGALTPLPTSFTITDASWTGNILNIRFAPPAGNKYTALDPSLPASRRYFVIPSSYFYHAHESVGIWGSGLTQEPVIFSIREDRSAHFDPVDAPELTSTAVQDQPFSANFTVLLTNEIFSNDPNLAPGKYCNWFRPASGSLPPGFNVVITNDPRGTNRMEFRLTGTPSAVAASKSYTFLIPEYAVGTGVAIQAEEKLNLEVVGSVYGSLNILAVGQATSPPVINAIYGLKNRPLLADITLSLNGDYFTVLPPPALIRSILGIDTVPVLNDGDRTVDVSAYLNAPADTREATVLHIHLLGIPSGEFTGVLPVSIPPSILHYSFSPVTKASQTSNMGFSWDISAAEAEVLDSVNGIAHGELQNSYVRIALAGDVFLPVDPGVSSILHWPLPASLIPPTAMGKNALGNDAAGTGNEWIINKPSGVEEYRFTVSRDTNNAWTIVTIYLRGISAYQMNAPIVAQIPWRAMKKCKEDLLTTSKPLSGRWNIGEALAGFSKAEGAAFLSSSEVGVVTLNGVADDRVKNNTSIYITLTSDTFDTDALDLVSDFIPWFEHDPGDGDFPLAMEIGGISQQNRTLQLKVPNNASHGSAPLEGTYTVVLPAAVLTACTVDIRVDGAIVLGVVSPVRARPSGGPAPYPAVDQGSVVNAQVDITLERDTFVDSAINALPLGRNITSWFTNIPTGLTATALANSGGTLRVGITGTAVNDITASGSPRGSWTNAEVTKGASGAAINVKIPKKVLAYSTWFVPSVGGETAAAADSNNYIYIDDDLSHGSTAASAVRWNINRNQVIRVQNSGEAKTLTDALGLMRKIQGPAAVDGYSDWKNAEGTPRDSRYTILYAYHGETINGSTSGDFSDNHDLGWVSAAARGTVSLTLTNRSANNYVITFNGTGASGADKGGSLLSIGNGAEVTLGGSLTLAGGTVNPSNGSLFTVSGDGTFILADTAVIRDNRASLGAAVHGASASSTVKLSGGTITGNTVTGQGGGVFIQGTLVLSGTTITGNKAGTDGGGIYMNGGTFTMDGGTISSNDANGGNGGGGIYMRSGTFDFKDGLIKANRGKYGGGIDFDTTSVFNMSGGIIENNIASAGGGGINYASSSTASVITGGIIRGNTVGATAPGTISYGAGAGQGAAFRSNKGTVTFSGGTISGNTAYPSAAGAGNGAGGGVFLFTTASFVMSGSTTIIEGNSADTGGGVYTTDTGAFTMTAGSLRANTASKQGGGVYQNGTFTMGSGARITPESGKNDVYLLSGKTIAVAAAFTLTDTVARVTPASYALAGSPDPAGAALLSGTGVGASYARFTVTSAADAQWTAAYTPNASTWTKIDTGGTAYEIRTDGKLYYREPTNGFYVASGGNDANDGLTIDTPFATLARGIIAARYHGIASAASKTVFVAGALSRSAAATAAAGDSFGPPIAGSAFSVSAPLGADPITIQGVSHAGVSPALAQTASLRVVAVNSTGSLVFKNITIRGGNVPTLNGGGISVGGAASVTLGAGAAVGGNRALNGGGIYSEGEVILEAASLIGGASDTEGNRALNAAGTSGSGGGVYLAKSTAKAVMKNGASIAYNTSFLGGGVYLQNDTSTTSFTMEGGQIFNNKAGVSSALASTPEGTGKSLGGGIYAVSTGGKAVVSINGGVLNNGAAWMGGGVFIGERAEVTLKSKAAVSMNRVTDPAAKTPLGAGVHLSNFATSVLAIEGGEITGNAFGASGRGLGIYVSDNAKITLGASGVSFSGSLQDEVYLIYNKSSIGLVSAIDPGAGDINIRPSSYVAGMPILTNAGAAPSPSNTLVSILSRTDGTPEENAVPWRVDDSGKLARSELYVASTGNDSAGGTYAAPLKTMKKALENAKTSKIAIIYVIDTLTNGSEGTGSSDTSSMVTIDNQNVEIRGYAPSSASGVNALGYGNRRVFKITGNSTVLFKNLTISGGRGVREGAGIYANGSGVTLGLVEGAVITNNRTDNGSANGEGSNQSSKGGGLYAWNALVQLNGAVISGNQAYAGADGATTAATFNNSWGGGIFISGGILTINNSTIGGTQAYAAGDTWLTGWSDWTSPNADPPAAGKFSQGNGAGWGGGIFAHTNALIYLGTNSAIQFNRANTTGATTNETGSGGGIFMWNGAAVNMGSDSAIRYNYASAYGGGVFLYNQPSVSNFTMLPRSGVSGLEGCIAFNEARVGGGFGFGRNTDRGIIDLQGGIVTGNRVFSDSGHPASGDPRKGYHSNIGTPRGAAIFLPSATSQLKMGGAAKIDAGNTVEFTPAANLPGPHIEIASALTSPAPVAVFTDYSGQYTTGRLVLGGTAALVSAHYVRFQTDPSTSSVIDSTGRLLGTVYVQRGVLGLAEALDRVLTARSIAAASGADVSKSLSITIVGQIGGASINADIRGGNGNPGSPGYYGPPRVPDPDYGNRAHTELDGAFSFYGLQGLTFYGKTDGNTGKAAEFIAPPGNRVLTLGIGAGEARPLVFDGATIDSGNGVGGDGTGITFSGGKPTWNEGGGGIYINGTSATHRSNIVFKNVNVLDSHTSDSDLGGGVYAYWTVLDWTGGKIAGNRPYNTSAATGTGGGIYARASLLTLTDVAVGENGNPNRRGGIWVRDGSLTLAGATSVSYNDGAGLEVRDMGASPSVANGVKFNHNTGSGIIAVNTPLSLKGLATEVSNNGADGINYSHSTATTAMTLSGLRIEKNTGSGIRSSAAVTIDYSAGAAKINENSGGALTHTGTGPLNITRVWAFEKNERTGSGGAISVIGGSSSARVAVNITDSYFRENKALGAASGGGALYAKWADVTLTATDGLSFAQNVSGGNGGAISVEDGDLTIAAPRSPAIYVIDDNSAGGNGGGISFTGGGVFSMSGDAQYMNKMDGNKASGGKGGAVYLSATGGSLRMEHTEITDNQAAAGGAIYHEGPVPLVLSKNFVVDNIAAGEGGGLYHTGGGLVTVSGNRVDANRAGKGGGIYVKGGQVNLTDGTRLDGNTATGTYNPGNGAYLDTGGILGFAGDSYAAGNNEVAILQGGGVTNGAYIRIVGALANHVAGSGGNVTARVVPVKASEGTAAAFYEPIDDTRVLVNQAGTVPIAASDIARFDLWFGGGHSAADWLIANTGCIQLPAKLTWNGTPGNSQSLTVKNADGATLTSGTRVLRGTTVTVQIVTNTKYEIYDLTNNAVKYTAGGTTKNASCAAYTGPATDKFTATYTFAMPAADTGLGWPAITAWLPAKVWVAFYLDPTNDKNNTTNGMWDGFRNATVTLSGTMQGPNPGTYNVAARTTPGSFTNYHGSLGGSQGQLDYAQLPAGIYKIKTTRNHWQDNTTTVTHAGGTPLQNTPIYSVVMRRDLSRKVKIKYSGHAYQSHADAKMGIARAYVQIQKDPAWAQLLPWAVCDINGTDIQDFGKTYGVDQPEFTFYAADLDGTLYSDHQNYTVSAEWHVLHCYVHDFFFFHYYSTEWKWYDHSQSGTMNFSGQTYGANGGTNVYNFNITPYPDYPYDRVHHGHHGTWNTNCPTDTKVGPAPP